MARESLELSVTLQVSAPALYAAWLDPEAHAAFTGGAATIDPRVGGRYTAWDGYIQGKILELGPGPRIVQSWRTTDFKKSERDSKLELRFEPHRGGTRLTLIHTELPKGGAAKYDEGWQDHYFGPMKKYFKAKPKKATKKKATKKKPAKKKAAKKKPAKKKPAKKKPSAKKRRSASSRAR